MSWALKKPLCVQQAISAEPQFPKRPLGVVDSFKILSGGLITLLPSAGKGGAPGG